MWTMIGEESGVKIIKNVESVLRKVSIRNKSSIGILSNLSVDKCVLFRVAGIAASLKQSTSSNMYESIIKNQRSFTSLNDETSGTMSPGVKYGAPLRGNTIPRRIAECQYAVRGPILNHAYNIMDELKVNPSKYPFKSVLRCNLGNPQEVGQPPFTYIRQILAAYAYPDLLKQNVFPKDIIERVQSYLSESLPGPYSNSQGIFTFRKIAAEFFQNRDNIETKPADIFLTNGASAAIQMVMNSLIRCPSDAIMVPVPQYPLYGASVTLFDGYCADYFLQEEAGWGCNRQVLQESYDRATKNGADVRAIVVINPGNPTGALMKKDCLGEIIKFCEEKNIAILADEVYQNNIYGDTEFISMRKVAHEMNSPVQMFSFHSASKGLAGECGIRGGVMHMTNVGQEAGQMLYKYCSVSLCSNTLGQALMGAVLTPPKEGDASFPLYEEECKKIYKGLKSKAQKMAKALSQMEGVHCDPIEASLYAFPKIHLPAKAIEAAKEKDIEPDLLYCYELLDATGIVVVPGSGFGQIEGTFHYRTTILPQEEDLDNAIEAMKVFHAEFLKKYGGL